MSACPQVDNRERHQAVGVAGTAPLTHYDEHSTGPPVGGKELYRGTLTRYPYLANSEMPLFDLRPLKLID